MYPISTSFGCILFNHCKRMASVQGLKHGPGYRSLQRLELPQQTSRNRILKPQTFTNWQTLCPCSRDSPCPLTGEGIICAPAHSQKGNCCTLIWISVLLRLAGKSSCCMNQMDQADGLIACPNDLYDKTEGTCSTACFTMLTHVQAPSACSTSAPVIA